MPRIGSVLATSRSQNGADFVWRIQGFQPEDIERGERLGSPAFSSAGREWFVAFGKRDPSSDSSPVVVRLWQCTGSPPDPVVRYWLGVGRADGNREEKIGKGRWKPKTALHGVVHPWLPFSKLQRKIERFAPSGTLSFFIRFRTGPESDNEMRNLVECDEPASSLEATTEKCTQRDFEDTLILKEHLKKLLLSADDHDVLLRVKNTEFKAHKSMLRARSPVFEAMFKHEMRENMEDAVNIEDVDPDCFGMLLEYIYTGEVENISATSAIGLYYASDKYDFPTLKRRCLQVLEASLSTSLVCDVIILAETYGEEELLKNAMAYFTEHQDEVMKTVEWKRFSLSNPIRASEVCLEAVRRYRASHS